MSNYPNFRESTSDEMLRAWDQYAHALTTIDETHRMIHDGFSYHCTSRTTVANGGDLDILLVNPAGSFPHMNGILFSLSDSPCDIKTYSGATTSAAGVVVTRWNRNLNSSNESKLIASTGPTITDLGTQIHDRFVPDAGGQGSKDVGLVTPNFGEEWILVPETEYIVRLTNNSGGSITVSMEMLWYEIGYDVGDD